MTYEKSIIIRCLLFAINPGKLVYLKKFLARKFLLKVTKAAICKTFEK